MPAYSFKKRFVMPIRVGLGLIGLTDPETGIEVPCELVLDDGAKTPHAFDPMRDLDPPIRPKRQTIRAEGKRRHARLGETLQLYTAMRTKQCKLIGKARCTAVVPITINFEYRYQPDWPAGRIEFGDERAQWSENPPMHVCQGQENLDNFARLDGFEGWAEMRDFWDEEHGLGEFKGVLIRWEPLP